jgi:hypothetical protein
MNYVCYLVGRIDEEVLLGMYLSRLQLPFPAMQLFAWRGSWRSILEGSVELDEKYTSPTLERR